MVFYFLSNPPPAPVEAEPPAKTKSAPNPSVPPGFSGEIPGDGCLLYMGRDKHENETLIKFAWPEDVWFHVDKESSAHVYIRLPRGSHVSGDAEWYKRIHPKVIEDCCQLVKANSIKGNKLDNVSIVFTPASNLKKSHSMEIGQVGFQNPNLVFKVKVETRKNEIVNRLEKTRRWVDADLEAELMARMKEDKAEAAARAMVDKAEKEKQEAEVDSDGEVDFM